MLWREEFIQSFKERRFFNRRLTKTAISNRRSLLPLAPFSLAR
jgi:hypothetical protein